ncbi:MAG TPA: CAP domain-containing protein [Ktedonobacteraceae bacterium]|nr:CAP domain-containing protein [Ktedonobacteraceae bacterium]
MNSIKIKFSWSIFLSMLLFLLCACSTSTGSQTSSQQSSPTAMESQIAQTVFKAINQSRAANGLPALKWSNALAESARQHDLAMETANTLSHQLPGEADLGTRESQQGVKWTFAAENIGETTEQSANGALALHQAMMNEKPPDDGHRQNILSKNANIVGVAILIDQQHEKLWLTEDFAQV